MIDKLLERIGRLPKVWSVILLLLFIVFLYVTLQKGIMPAVMGVVESNFFFESEEETEELGKINNARSEQALKQCKSLMLGEKHVPENAQFVDKDYEGWALGGKVYLIRSHVLVNSPDQGMQDRKYACKIKLNKGDPADANNWESLGVDFNEPG